MWNLLRGPNTVTAAVVACVTCLLTISLLNVAKFDRTPIDSFVSVQQHITASYRKCAVFGKTAPCDENLTLKLEAASSGVIVGENLILTAGHVCESLLSVDMPPAPVTGEPPILEIKNTIVDYYGYEHEIKDVVIYDSADLCLVTTIETVNGTRATLATRSPHSGDKIVNVAAPVETYVPNAVPIFSGFYAGELIDNKAAISGVPVEPGSSGSPVFNEQGELVGIVISKIDKLEGYGTIVGLTAVRDFLKSHQGLFGEG